MEYYGIEPRKMIPGVNCDKIQRDALINLANLHKKTTKDEEIKKEINEFINKI